MKILLILLALLFAGCSTNRGKPCFVKEIPAYNQQVATQYVEKLMQSIQVQSRNDDEDWDDFILAAHNSAVDIYSVELRGTFSKNSRDCWECDCAEERAKQQITAAGQP